MARPAAPGSGDGESAYTFDPVARKHRQLMVEEGEEVEVEERDAHSLSRLLAGTACAESLVAWIPAGDSAPLSILPEYRSPSPDFVESSVCILFLLLLSVPSFAGVQGRGAVDIHNQPPTRESSAAARSPLPLSLHLSGALSHLDLNPTPTA